MLPDSDSDCVEVIEVIDDETFDVSPPRPLRDPTIPRTGLDTKMIDIMRLFCVPMVVFNILAIMFQSEFFQDIRDVDALELFAGAGAVTKNLALQGLLAIAYDIGIGGPSMDWNGGQGFITALQLWRRLRRGGFCWLGTVCSTWIYLSRWSTHRTTGDAIGDTSSASVREGNRQTARSALMMVLTWANQSCFVLEQPLSSMMMMFPPMLHIAHICRLHGFTMHKIETYMKDFGHAENKGTLLFSNELWTHGLIRENSGRGFEPSQLTHKFRRKCDGKLQCSGRGKELKASQEYPWAFGTEVATLFTTKRNDYDMCTITGPSDSEEYRIADEAGDLGDNVWADLDLDECLAFLMQHICAQ